jgi:hypothetical protein
MRLRKILILRSPRSGRLEGRNAPNPAVWPSRCAFPTYAVGAVLYRLSCTYSKSPGLPSMPALGGAIHEA